MTIPAYPLQWPEGWKRTVPGDRTGARFERNSKRLTIADGVARVRQQIEMMHVYQGDLVISTDLKLRLDGLPYSAQSEPRDPGAAIYWRDSRKDGWPAMCMAIDRYDRVADNLAAIAATLDAMRAIERHGGAEILNRAFTGFTAIEHETGQHWSELLCVSRTAPRAEIEAAYRRLRSHHHPDKGGDQEMFYKIQRAYDESLRAAQDS